MGFIKALVLLVAIPIFGFLVSNWVLSDINKEIADDGVDYIGRICAPEVIPQFKEVCDEIAPIMWLKTG